MLDDIKGILTDGPLGVRTGETFIQACLARAARPEETETVTLFVLARLAQPFCDFYAEQPLTAATAAEFRDRMIATIDAWSAAATPKDREAVLAGAIREALASA
jgi:hypothetical protein